MDALEGSRGGRSQDSRPYSSRVRPGSGSKCGVAARSSSSKLDLLVTNHTPSLPRPGTVPALWDKNGGLEIHSTPVPMVTRSLHTSARSTSNSSVTRPRRRDPRHHNSHSKTAHRNGPSNALRVRHSSPVVTGKTEANVLGTHHATPTSTGFNIVSHLHDMDERNCPSSPGSLSPEIDKFLQDISTALRSESPPTGSRLDTNTALRSESPPRQKENGRVSHRVVKPKRHQRPAIVANFSGGEAASHLPVKNGVLTEGINEKISDGAHTTYTQNSSGNVASSHSKSVVNTASGSHSKPVVDTASGSHSKPLVDTASGSHSKPLIDTASGSHSKPLVDLASGSRSKPSGSGSIPLVADSQTKREAAARRIQCWYRERQLSQVQSMLMGKREELNKSKVEELKRLQDQAEQHRQHEAERQQRRAVKMQAARKAAIEDLQRKREEKRRETERIAQEEIALLQASGKIKKPKSQKRLKGKREAGGGDGSGGERKREPVPSSGRERKREPVPGSGGEGKREPVPDSVIDEFFEAGTSKQPPPATSSPAVSKDKHNTYTDILETLKLLEEEPPPLQGSGNDEGPLGYLSANNLRKLGSAEKRVPLTAASLGEGKLQSILSYLDEMEKADSDFLLRLSSSHSKPRPEGLSTPAATTREKQKSASPQHHQLNNQLEAASAVASDVTATIMAQRMELDNKQKSVEMLQKALSQQRELTVYHAKEMEKEGQLRMDLQKQEYEATVQRHQCFIDQLIDDKKALSERCEQLVGELKDVDKKFRQKIKGMEESHTAELSKLKQVSAAADKLRREKWRTEETQRIKEATVKSLEPEIQRIIAKGKADIQRLKALHEAELLQSDERASRRFVSQMEELRALCATEKEQACAHERELSRQRYEKLAEQEEINYQQQRRKLFGEVQQERDRLASQVDQQRVELEREFRERQEAQGREVEEMRSLHVRTMEEVQRRHTSELRDLEERLNIEKQAWEENYMKKQDTAMMTREREMREGLRHERDKEIEMVIGRLEEETAQSKAECERAAEARIKRIREKYEAELREVERSERKTLEKFNTMKSQLAELEGEVARMRSLLRQKEQEVDQISEVASKLTRERDSVTDIVRQEFADRLVMTEEENKQLKIEMSELRARHKVELERVGKVKNREMEEVHERVKQALAKKEDNLKVLRVQHEAALKRADHLEMLLERQRKELLRK